MSKWSDLGDLNAVWSEGQQINLTLSSCCLTAPQLLRSESSSQQIVGIGLDDIMVIAMLMLFL